MALVTVPSNDAYGIMTVRYLDIIARLLLARTSDSAPGVETIRRDLVNTNESLQVMQEQIGKIAADLKQKNSQ